jgi:hypothetical protein
VPRQANQTSFTSESARAAVAARWDKCEDRTAATAHARELSIAGTKARGARISLDRYVRAVVDRAPDLTADQIARLAAILPPAAGGNAAQQDVA